MGFRALWPLSVSSSMPVPTPRFTAALAKPRRFSSPVTLDSMKSDLVPGFTATRLAWSLSRLRRLSASANSLTVPPLKSKEISSEPIVKV